ncbi:MAG TPA: cytochrome c3 family protein, partial [Vicinamibacterales bacterium]|nr:cytochrome c3 family protein [Vicinamibacterales bacterium]
AGCHQSTPGAPDPEHVSLWQRSAHGRHDVGCEKCHGGDPATADTFQAHRGIVPSARPTSPTNRANLPTTCGVCHAGPFVAFQKSRHFALLQASSSADVPTCSTCHGAVAANLLSPDALARECARCHADGEPAGHPEYPKNARATLYGIQSARKLLNQAQEAIRRVDNKEARASLEQSYEQAEVPLTEAIQEAHQFIYFQSSERLNVALIRAENLLKQLGKRR